MTLCLVHKLKFDAIALRSHSILLKHEFIFYKPGFFVVSSSLYFRLTLGSPVGCAAIVSGGKGTAQDKIKTLREAGVTVVESPAKIGTTMLEVFKQRGLV